MPYIERERGVKIHYDDHGQGFPLVFLHGFSTNAWLWVYQVPIFARKYRCVVIEARGHGRSDRPLKGYSIPEMAADDAAVLTALGIDRAILVGNSMGGSFGKYAGREAIRTFFQGAPKLLPFAIHQVMNPLIEVQGERATGKWYLFQPCTLAEGNQAAWLAARYEEEYVKVGGGWQFTQLKVFSSFMTPYDQGWVKQKFV